MIGQLTTEETENLLRRSLIGRIGCNDGTLTYVVPISYAYDGQQIYCHTTEGLKVDILRKNPQVCFEVEQLESMANWQTVIVQGTFEELTDPTTKLNALQKLNNRKLPFINSQTTHLTAEWPFASETLSLIQGVTFAIHPTSKSGRFEKAPLMADLLF
jgi:nitroimidazol reductase NimA-like FMN-containing flavoprotein (pyridoxamine 5'-phosphate oxidase superfamily)